MNRALTVVAGLIGLAIIAGLIYYGSVSTPSSYYATSTSPIATTSDTTTTPPIVQAPEPHAPVVITDSAVNNGETTAIVTGTVIPEGALTSYWYEYGTSASFGSRTSDQTIGSGFTTINAPGYITGLAKNTTYYFRLVAENQYGKVYGKEYPFNTKAGNPVPVGGKPSAATSVASSVARTTAIVNGTVNPNKVTTSYWFEYGKTSKLGNIGGFGSSVAAESGTVSVGTALSNLDPLTTYYFRLNAQNQFGTVTGTILTFKTLGPAASTAPSATTQSATSINSSSAALRGTVNPNGADTTYWFEYGTDSLLAATSRLSTAQKFTGVGTASTSVTATVTQLKSNMTYYFRTVAQNNLGMTHGTIQSFKTK